jgi:CRP-like cAMP-binding protein
LLFFCYFFSVCRFYSIFNLAQLSDNFIFAGLTPQEYTLLINAMHHHSVAVGDVIMHQGDLGDYFYVLKSGQVAFIVNGKQVGEAYEGATFGELALLYDAPRAATVRAVTDCSLYRVDQKTFRAMLANNKARSGEKRVKLLKEVEIFNGIDSAILHKIADAMTDLVISDGEKIFRKGEVGEVFYIVSSGRVKITDIGLGDAKYVDQILNPGDFFGERALMTGDTRAGTATALGDCALLCISKETFDTGIGHFEKVMTHSQNKRNIMGVPIFAKAKLDPAEVERLSKRIVSVTIPKDTSLLEEGKSPTTIQRGLYIIKEGEISVSSPSGVVRILRSGDYFGDDLILEKPDVTSPFNYIVRETAVCDVISVEDIKSALNGLARLERENSTIISRLDDSITLKTVNKVKMLGSGTFGQVWLISHIPTKKTYALKIQVKRELIDNGQASGVVREKNLMAALDHPFVIKLVNAFQDEECLYMVMTLAQGGELYSILHTAKSDGVPESSAKFYAATIFDGLTHMHERHILYRDLKPEVSFMCTVL